METVLHAPTKVLAHGLWRAGDKGELLLAPSVHPFRDLLQMSADQVLVGYRQSQQRDFLALFANRSRSGREPIDEIPQLRQALLARTEPRLCRAVSLDQMRSLFLALHDHVMGHPVWLHPFFRRFFEGRFTRAQLVSFIRHYLNQVKNTRQCVALAIGRFHSLARLPFDHANEIVSELTQVVLAGLIADEYGVSAHLADVPQGVDVAALFSSTTHITLYRQLFEAIDLPFERQDTPLLPGIADNVLTQRLLAGSPAFSELEALASVGLGMEWGVPAFFSLLLGGLLRYAHHNEMALTPRHVEVLTAHVRQDVAHAISVMLVTAMLADGEEDFARIRNATNLLMASRYQMMSDIYTDVFGESCSGISEIALPAEYHVSDRRIEDEIVLARRQADPRKVSDYARWLASDPPFVFAH